MLHFYNELASLVRAVPRHNVLIIAGDMNAQLGRNQHHKHAFHVETNRNGKHFNHFLTENNLYCLNTRFPKKSGKLWSHTYPNSVKAQLDYISVNKKWINSVQNCEAYNSFEGVSSDHRILSIKVQLSLRANKKKSSIKPSFDWKQLSSNADIRHKFTITLQNRFSQLQNDDNDNINPNNTSINFMNAHKQAAEDCIPLKHKTKHKLPWENEIVEQKCECLKILANLKNKTPTSTNIRNYRKARQELEGTYNIEQHKYIQEQIETIRNAAENKQSSLAWQTVNEVTGRKRSTQAKLEASSQDERLQKWKEHFQNLLGKAPVIKDQPIQQIIDNELPIKKGHFSEEELETVLKKLKNKKAPGLDEIPPEVWKTRSFNDILLKSCNSLYNQSSIQIWTEGCILPFPKKGDLSLATNYKGITLTPIAAKIYNSMLLNRIQPEVEKILRRNQNGFRKNRSTVGQILTVRRIIEGVKANNLEAVILFVDFSKAFDPIHRGKIAEISIRNKSIRNSKRNNCSYYDAIQKHHSHGTIS